MRKLFKRFKPVHYYSVGKQLLNDHFYKLGQQSSQKEYLKTPKRTTIINYLLSVLNRPTTYLEIGVRNPKDNFYKIKAEKNTVLILGLNLKKILLTLN